MKFTLKVVIAGDLGVGKSEFASVSDFRNAAPTPDSKPRSSDTTSTIGVDVFTAKRTHTNVHRENNQMVDCESIMTIWDTAGQEKFRALVKNYFRGANVVILMYSIIDRQSYLNVTQYWYELAKSEVPKWCKFFLVGTKADLVNTDSGKREVELAEVQTFVESIGAHHFEADSKSRGGYMSYTALTAMSHLACETAQEAVAPVSGPSLVKKKPRKRC